MRYIYTHRTNPCNDAIGINVVDDPGPGGANHEYVVTGNFVPVRIHFQNGPIQEVGVNGITQEVLMAICIDRLRSFQAGPYACRENALALTHLEESLHWLQSRTREREMRGVEGTMEL